jgi:hypothetical protein
VEIDLILRGDLVRRPEVEKLFRTTPLSVIPRVLHKRVPGLGDLFPDVEGVFPRQIPSGESIVCQNSESMPPIDQPALISLDHGNLMNGS